MKNRFIYVGTIALMASAMALAQSTSTQSTSGQTTMDSQTGSSATSAPQAGDTHTDTQGDLPAVKEGEQQRGSATQSDQAARPGAMGTPTTPDAGTTPKGETPATGDQTEQKGQSGDTGARPGTEPSTPAANGNDTNSTPKSMSSNPDSSNKPDYAKPITSMGSSTDSKPAQKSTDKGTESPDK